jgi:hypothetical protein
MTGVEILSQEVVYNTIVPEWCGFFGGMLGAVLVVLFFECLMDGYNVAARVFGVLVLICTTLFILGLITNKNSIDHIEYKVTISDEVSMTEFMAKYEILEEDGKIYTVRERE